MQGTLAVLVSIQGVFQKRKKRFTLTALRDKTVKYSKKSSSYTPSLPDVDFFCDDIVEIFINIFTESR